MSTGFANAGFNIAYAVDHDIDSLKTFKRNHKKTKTINCKIEQLDFSFMNDIDIVIGGFPCTPFSNTRRNGNKDEEHKDHNLYNHFLRVIKETKPKVFVMENVPTFKNAFNVNTNKKIINIINEFSRELGYETMDWTINMANWGLPQKRERLLIIGSRIGRIEITHYTHENNLGLVTVDEALSDIKVQPFIEPKDIGNFLEYDIEPLSEYQQKRRKHSSSIANHFITKHNHDVSKRFPYVKEGGNWRDIPFELFNESIKKKQSNIYKRLDRNNQATTITHVRKTLLLHPLFNRTLSAREAARIQGFDDDFIFVGKKDSIYQQIGNAVPPLVAENIAKEVMNYFLQSSY